MILLVSDRPLIEQHLLDLDENSRRLRFGYQASNESIIKYLDRAFDQQSTWFGYIDHGVCIGAAHVHVDENAVAEIGISISTSHRGNGLCSTLFDRVILYLQSKKVKTVMMQCLSENKVMQYLAKKYGMNVVTISPGEKQADVAIDNKVNAASAMLLDASQDAISLVDSSIRNQLWLAEVLNSLFLSYIPKGLK